MEVSQHGGVDRAALTHLILLSRDKSVVYLPYIATKVIIFIKARPENITIFKCFAVRGGVTLNICSTQRFAMYLVAKYLK